MCLFAISNTNNFAHFLRIISCPWGFVESLSAPMCKIEIAYKKRKKSVSHIVKFILERIQREDYDNALISTRRIKKIASSAPQYQNANIVTISCPIIVSVKAKKFIGSKRKREE